MQYLQTENGFIYAYDDEDTMCTFVFKNGQWDISRVMYFVMEWDERGHFDYLTEADVLEFTGGLSVYEKVQSVKRVLSGEGIRDEDIGGREKK